MSDGPAECETLSCVLINIKTAEKGSRRFTSLQARLCTLRAKLDNNGTQQNGKTIKFKFLALSSGKDILVLQLKKAKRANYKLKINETCL